MNTEEHRSTICVALGPDAHPTVELRMLTTSGDGLRGGSARMQQRWEGRYGSGWYELPDFPVDEMPPRLTADVLSPWYRDAAATVPESGPARIPDGYYWVRSTNPGYKGLAIAEWKGDCGPNGMWFFTGVDSGARQEKYTIVADGPIIAP